MSESKIFSLRTPPYEGPQPGEIYSHTNGNLYRVMFVTNLGAPERWDKHPPDVIYDGENGNVWSRPMSDWARSMTLVAGNGGA